MYDYQCTECGGITSRFRKIKDRNDLMVCMNCEGIMKLAILSAPFGVVQPDIHYVCPATGKQITSMGQRKNTFAEYGLEAADPDQQNEIAQRRLQKKKDREKAAAEYLPPDLKEKIAQIGQNSDNPFVS
jgi:putative FmdB family regulatory protein